MEFATLKVSQLVEAIKGHLESRFRNLLVEGEVSNLSSSSSGHWYFTLSDKDASLSVALFKLDALANPFIKAMKDGDLICVQGNIGVYEKRGTFQIIAKKIVPLGKGDLKEQFEKLKRRLASEGLFDLDKKKTIPLIPKRVAIITAAQGAALQDFINIYRRRALWMDVLVVPALVQGGDAPKSIRNALHNVIKFSMDSPPEKKIDVIVLARGGGSLEDLWAFNDEGLAWDLFNCPIPTMSAVGHEVDYSISDFVCDKRAETPSAAAEILTQIQTQIKERMKTLHLKLIHVMKIKMHAFKSRLKENNPHAILNILSRKFQILERKLERCNLKNRLNELTHLHEFYMRLDELIETSLRSIIEKYKDMKTRSGHAMELLVAFNPKGVLSRGYTYLSAGGNKILGSKKSFEQLPSETSIEIHFHDGTSYIKKE